MSYYFVAGTDTGVGKTMVTSLLLQQGIAQGKTVLGLKPVAAGCQDTALGWRNEDAVILQARSNVTVPYDRINAVALPAATSPHIAAAKCPITITAESVWHAYDWLSAESVDQVFFEGAGGWYCPLNDDESMADFVCHWRLRDRQSNIDHCSINGPKLRQCISTQGIGRHQKWRPRI